MKIARRSFLATLIGTTALPTLSGYARESSVIDAVSPARLASDPLRPQYHFLPAANWMNDPNGPIYWNGNYHMFYQYNPNGAFWGDMHWGHAISKDMIHWRHLPVALAPTPDGPDADGCFTGTAVVQDGHVVLLYTGVHAAPEDQGTIKDGTHSLRESQCLAISSDPDLKVWTKAPNPVIAVPPNALDVNGFRDPSPWRQGDWWYTVLGSGFANQGGAVLLYKSKDLRSWEYVHILAKRDQIGSGRFDPFDPWEVWECPEFFALGDRYVLIFSTSGKAYWLSGRLDTETMIFTPEQSGLLDYGTFYAPKTQLDKSGNRIIWGWITEARPVTEYKAAGWAGLMSLPRVLSVAADGRLRIGVSAEVSQLRDHEHMFKTIGDQEQDRHQIDSMRLDGCCGEILCTVRRTSEPFELTLSGSAENADPWLKLKYDPRHTGQISIDARPLPVIVGENEDIELHLYVDGSVMEVFVNQQAAWTKRFYYPGGRPQDLRVQWTGSTANIASLSTWQLTPISANRLTT